MDQGEVLRVLQTREREGRLRDCDSDVLWPKMTRDDPRGDRTRGRNVTKLTHFFVGKSFG